MFLEEKATRLRDVVLNKDAFLRVPFRSYAELALVLESRNPLEYVAVHELERHRYVVPLVCVRSVFYAVGTIFWYTST